MPSALLLDRVSKHFSGHTAVDDLSLDVPAGTIYGILGPNGAGKSTTIRMAMNIIARDTGHVSLLGVDPAVDRNVLRRVGYLPEERGLYRKMRVIDVIAFFGALKGLKDKEARRRGREWVERMGLGDWAEARVDTLSKGMQQKVQFITTVVHDPDLLVLDEPASGLDPVNQDVLRETILDAKRRGKTVLFSTHNMDQAEGLCEYVCIIAGGRKVLDGELTAIRRAHRGAHYRVAFDTPSETAEAFVRTAPLFREVVPEGDGWRVELAPETDARAAVAALNALDVPLSRFARVEPSLHEIFVDRVGDVTPARR
ncbi:MAG TPA: ATP-binding cassette domain-containing protein [Rhodothermales bacterium]|nr:ATP-binding cassette domain-containing protein [Rhodothermales bacterium]